MTSSYHIPVLLEESINGLAINPEGIYVDATFGGGGHSREILKKLNQGKLYAFDQDFDAAAHALKNENFFFIMHNFRYIRNFLRYFNVPRVDGILADLGVSSHDFDVAERGFSFRLNGNLDMRMNQKRKKNAKDIINNYSKKDLQQIFMNFGEIRNAGLLAGRIVEMRKDTSIETTHQLKEIAVSFTGKQNETKYLAKVFQAIRMEVNEEMEALEEFLKSTIEVLKPGGRLVILTYHSLEDRLVKNFMKSGNIKGKIEKDFFGNISSPFKLINRKVITPGDEECNINPRARSAKLRITERI